MKEDLIIINSPPGKAGPQDNKVIFNEEEFGLGITPNWDPTNHQIKSSDKRMV